MSVDVCGVRRTRVNMFATTLGEGVCVVVCVRAFCVVVCVRACVLCCGVRVCVCVRACVCVSVLYTNRHI